MKQFAFIIASIFVSACAGERVATESKSYASAYELAETQWAEIRETEAFGRFQAEWLNYIDSKNTDAEDACGALADDAEEIILVLNASGVVDEVITKDASDKSMCFKEVFTGQKHPPPPVAPFYMPLRMRQERTLL